MNRYFRWFNNRHFLSHSSLQVFSLLPGFEQHLLQFGLLRFQFLKQNHLLLLLPLQLLFLNKNTVSNLQTTAKL